MKLPQAKFLKYFLITFFLLITLFFTAVLILYRIQVSIEKGILLLEEKDLVNNFTARISLELDNISKDILILSRLSSTNNYLESKSLKSLRDLEADFLDFSGSKKKYDQVRFLSSNGYEIIRVDLKNGEAVLLPPERLQDKSDRYYFTDAIKLKPGQIYLSPLDLNIEYGKIEEPRKPMIRFATPVSFKDGKVAGVIVFNYLANSIVKNVGEDITQCSGHYNFMTNKDGYWLKGFKEEDEYSFMFNKEIKFQDRFPEEWNTINQKDKGQFETKKGVFTFSTVYPILETYLSKKYLPLSPDKYSWKIITYLPTSVVASYGKRLILLLIPIIAFVIIIVFVSSFLFAKSVQKRIDSRNELIEASEMKAKFASIAAHELKIPLTVIKEGVDLISDGTLGEINEKQNKAIGMIRQEIDRMVRMAMQFLDFQKIKLKKIELDLRENDLNELITRITENMQSLALSKNITLQTKLDENMPRFSFDSDRINQVLENCLNNAFKFTKKGSITVSSKLDGNAVCVKVIDTGLGIKKEEITDIFEPFKQAASGLKSGGTGLGMFISKEIIKAHGGNIWVESEYGEGTVFSFIIPVKKDI